MTNLLLPTCLCAHALLQNCLLSWYNCYSAFQPFFQGTVHTVFCWTYSKTETLHPVKQDAMHLVSSGELTNEDTPAFQRQASNVCLHWHQEDK